MPILDLKYTTLLRIIGECEITAVGCSLLAELLGKPEPGWRAAFEGGLALQSWQLPGKFYKNRGLVPDMCLQQGLSNDDRRPLQPLISQSKQFIDSCQDAWLELHAHGRQDPSLGYRHSPRALSAAAAAARGPKQKEAPDG